MKNSLIGILALVEKELKQLFRNKMLVAMLLFFPVLAVFVIMRVYNFDVKNVNVAVVDADRSALSAMLTDGLDHSGRVTLYANCTTYNEAFDLMERGDIDCIAVFPKGLESSYFSSNRQKVQLSVKAVDITRGLLGAKSIQKSVLTTISKYFKQQGIDVQPKEEVISEINLYNPAMDYLLFMVSVALLTIAFTVCSNVSVNSMFNEEVSGVAELMNVSPLRPWVLVVAKILSCYIAELIAMAVGIASSYFGYGMPDIHSFGVVFIIYSLYILGVPAFAVFINNITSNPMQASILIIAFLSISQNMSGFLTPSESMVEWMQRLNIINPAYYAIVALRSVYMKGAGLIDILRPLGALAVQCVVLWTLAICTFKKRQL